MAEAEGEGNVGEVNPQGSPGDPGTGGDVGVPGAGGTESPDPWSTLVGTLDEDARGYVQAKGFDGLDSAINSYRNLEKAIGIPKDEIARIPKNGDPEQMKELFTRLGTPADPTGYKDAIEIPEGDDGEFARQIVPLFHKANLTVDQARTLASGWNEMMGAQAEHNETEYANTLDAQTNELKAEWGSNYENRMLAGKAAMDEFGISAEQIGMLEKAMGFKDVIKTFAQIGEKIGEASLVGGEDGGSDITTPEQAQHQLNALKSDPLWVKKYQSGDVQARQEMERLQRIMFPGQIDV